jgi:arsenate reductase-like glutaredoxin family protein
MLVSSSSSASSFFRAVLSRRVVAVATAESNGRQFLHNKYRLFSTAATATVTDMDGTGPPSMTLYQYAICPFCHKTKAFLAYVGIPHEIVEVNPLTKAELKPWSGEYRKVPICKITNTDHDEDHVQIINGSDEIIQALMEHSHVKKQLHDKNNSQLLVSLADDRWSKFAHEELASLLYPNICSTLSDSYHAFGYVKQVPTFSTLDKLSIRTLGSFAMYMAASRIKCTYMYFVSPCLVPTVPWLACQQSMYFVS